jgi:hypothetical protein
MKKIKRKKLGIGFILLIILCFIIISIIVAFSIIWNECSCGDGENFQKVMLGIKENKKLRDEEIFARKNGYGIVLIAGGPVYGKLALENVKSLRKKGSILPVEIFYLGKDELDNEYMKELEIMENISLVNIFDYYDLSKLKFPSKGLGCFLSKYSTNRGRGFVSKALALKFSKFRHIIILDADNLCLQNPDKLFNSRFYSEYGAILWRDMHEDFSQGVGVNIGIFDAMKFKTIGKMLKNLSTHSNEQALHKLGWSTSMPQICSAQLVMDTVKHSLGVDYIANINENAEIIYGDFWGDKDTYAFGLKLAGEEYYVVPQKPIFMGKNWKGQFYGHSFIQVYPDDNSFLFQHRNSHKNQKDEKYNNLPDEYKYALPHQVPVLRNLEIMGYDYENESRGGYKNTRNFYEKLKFPFKNIFN